MTELDAVFRPVRELSERVRTRQVSPVALTRLFLDRLERIGPRYNAVVTLTADLAEKQAQDSEREIGEGRYRGPLHGIPYGLKDVFPPRATRRRGARGRCATRPSTTTPP